MLLYDVFCVDLDNANIGNSFGTAYNFVAKQIATRCVSIRG